MPTERWQRLKRLVESALQAPDSDREIVLQRNCAGDSDLLVEAQSLVRLADQPSQLLDPPLPGIGQDVALTAIAASGVTRRYGSYIATELLAAGPGGAVYRAFSARGGVAAIKVLRQEGCAAETSRRFERERRIL